jgi:hypothetical protein
LLLWRWDGLKKPGICVFIILLLALSWACRNRAYTPLHTMPCRHSLLPRVPDYRLSTLVVRANYFFVLILCTCPSAYKETEKCRSAKGDIGWTDGCTAIDKQSMFFGYKNIQLRSYLTEPSLHKG